MGKVDEQLKIVGCCGGDFCIGPKAHNKEIIKLFASLIKECIGDPNLAQDDGTWTKEEAEGNYMFNMGKLTARSEIRQRAKDYGIILSEETR